MFEQPQFQFGFVGRTLKHVAFSLVHTLQSMSERELCLNNNNFNLVLFDCNMFQRTCLAKHHTYVCVYVLKQFSFEKLKY